MQFEDDRYQLKELLGKGGTSCVYRATDTTLGVERAIKILNYEGKRRDSVRRRLRAEAQVMAALEHPNILRIYDVGCAGEADYIVMELAEGASLQDWIDKRGPMPPRLAANYLIQVLSALATAHAAGVIHRDLKPQNILLRSDGTALLADFGIALLAGDEGRRTRTGVAMGSLAFMAPEQRLDARSVGVTADLYAAASTFFHLMTRANPFDLFAASESSQRWGDLPASFRRVLWTATRYDPGERYDSARRMAGELIAAAQTLPGEANPLTAVEGAPHMLVNTYARTDAPWWTGDVTWSDATATAIHLLMEVPNPPTVRRAPPPSAPPAILEEVLIMHSRPKLWRYLIAVVGLGLLVIGGIQLGSWLGSPSGSPFVGLTPNALTGDWSGSLGGFPVDLVLSGTVDDLRGVMTVHVQTSEVSSEVRGRFDPNSHVLTLRDTNADSLGGTYTANLSESGDSLRGHWTATKDRRMLSFEARRGQ